MEAPAPRRDMTTVRNVRRADVDRAWQLAQTSQGREEMLKRFDEDVHTRAGHGVRSAQLATWTSIHELWLPGVPVVPLTWDSIRAVGAHMKEAGYRSWANYASRIKEAHISAGHCWTLQLDIAMKAAKRSVLRGLGPSKQAASLPLVDVAMIDDYDLMHTPAMPLGGVFTFLVIAFFMLREVEAAYLKVKHLVVDKVLMTIALTLSVSKVDPTASGRRRSWGRLCVEGQALPCP